MKVEVKKATVKQKPVLENLMQLYLYDFSEFAGTDVDRKGRFAEEHLDSYWKHPTRTPFIVYVDKKLAGFVLVNEHTYFYKKGEAKAFAEFFVMRKYRRKGVGKKVAFDIFDKFPGKWEIKEVYNNVDAQKFWREVIKDYTKGNFKEIKSHKKWRGPIQVFDNSKTP